MKNCIPRDAVFLCKSEYRAEEDLDADKDQNNTAENGCLACDLVAEFLADQSAEIASHEGNNADDNNADKRLDKSVRSDGKAYGEGVYRGCNSLYENHFRGDLTACAFLALAVASLVDHLSTDEA